MTLQEELQGCLDRISELLKSIDEGGRAMTEEEKQAYESDSARADKLQEEIKEQEQRKQKLEEAIKKADAIRSSVVNPLKTRGAFDGKSELRDLKKFSLGKALRSLASRGYVDGVEREVFEEGQKEARESRVGFDARAMVIPASAIRALSVGGTNGGTVASGVNGNIFELYQNRQILSSLGATIFDNLSGDLKINAQTGVGGTLGVIGETANATKVDPTLNTITLKPNRISAYTQLSNQLLAQSTPNVEAFAMDNLVKSIMSAFQGAVFGGGAEDSIVGIANATGVNSVSGGATWENILAMVGTLAGVDFDINKTGFALNSTTMAKLMSTLKSANNFEFIMSEGFNADGTKQLAGLKAGISNSVGNNIIFGAWEQLFVGMWGGVGVIYDPYTQAKNGSVEVVAEIFADAKIGNPSLFSTLAVS